MNKNYKYSIAHRKRHIERGLCLFCSNPRDGYSPICKSCKKRDIERSRLSDRYRKRRLRRSLENRCIMCGRHLIEGADDGFKTCINCRERNR